MASKKDNLFPNVCAAGGTPRHRGGSLIESGVNRFYVPFARDTKPESNGARAFPKLSRAWTTFCAVSQHLTSVFPVGAATGANEDRLQWLRMHIEVSLSLLKNAAWLRPLLFHPHFYASIAGTILMFVARWKMGLGRWSQRYREWRYGGWQAVPAHVDVVSVLNDDAEGKVKYYVANLTYFYRLPNLEMGEYYREFRHLEDARLWIDQLKHRQVLVRIDPRDVSRSVLLESDLEGFAAGLPTR